MQPLKEESPSPPSTLFKSLLKFAYTIHFILSFCLVTFIIAKYPEVISASITFVMLVIYGYMGLWVLLVGFILVVRISPFRFAKTTRRQLYFHASW